VYDNCIGVPRCSRRALREGRWGIKGESLGLRRKEKSSQAAKWEQEAWGRWACRPAWKPREGEQRARWRSTQPHWAGSKGQRKPAREEAERPQRAAGGALKAL